MPKSRLSPGLLAVLGGSLGSWPMAVAGRTRCRIRLRPQSSSSQRAPRKCDWGSDRSSDLGTRTCKTRGMGSAVLPPRNATGCFQGGCQDFRRRQRCRPRQAWRVTDGRVGGLTDDIACAEFSEDPRSAVNLKAGDGFGSLHEGGGGLLSFSSDSGPRGMGRRVGT